MCPQAPGGIIRTSPDYRVALTWLTVGASVLPAGRMGAPQPQAPQGWGSLSVASCLAPVPYDRRGQRSHSSCSATTSDGNFLQSDGVSSARDLRSLCVRQARARGFQRLVGAPLL